MSRSERIAQQLGMSHGAATNKLRKNILFDFLICLQENKCFRCGELILSANELSVEHKQPWEGRDTNLFWDLSNVAFSHAICNRPHSFNPGPQTKVGPEGTAWCCGHQRFEPAGNFWKNKSEKRGLQHYCKELGHSDRRPCEHDLEKIPVGDKRNPYKTDNYVCKNCHKEFRKA